MSRTTVCVYCGRRGTSNFVISSGTGDGQDTWRCANRDACERRQEVAERTCGDVHGSGEVCTRERRHGGQHHAGGDGLGWLA